MEDDNHILGRRIIGEVGGGTRSSHILFLEGELALKIYNGKWYPISFGQELDLTSRIIHPGIVKTYQFIDRNQLGGNSNHGLLMHRIRCLDPPNMTIKKRLEYLMVGLTANHTLIQNGYYHSDWHSGNQCITDDGFVFLDLNGASISPGGFSQVGIDSSDENRLLIFTNIQGFRPRNYKVKPNNYEPIVPVSDEDLLLLRDFLSRLIEKSNEDIFLNYRDLHLHPIFVKYGVDQVEARYEPRLYISTYRAPHNLYEVYDIWREFIDLEWMQKIVLLESIDLYQRYSPFALPDQNMRDVAIECIFLIADSYALFENERVSQFLLSSSTISNLALQDHIVKTVNGRLRDINFYHQISGDSELQLCIKLVTLPYQEYMRIKSDRFWEVVPMNSDLDFSLEEIVPLLQMDPVVERKYSFTRLSERDIREYAALVLGRAEDLYPLSAERLFVYELANKGRSQVRVTQAVADLVHVTDLNIKLPFQIKTNDLDNIEVFNSLLEIFKLEDKSISVLTDGLKRMLHLCIGIRTD